jgi:hypothetical protein
MTDSSAAPAAEAPASAARVMICDCGQIIRGDGEADLAAKAEAHTAAHHAARTGGRLTEDAS